MAEYDDISQVPFVSGQATSPIPQAPQPVLATAPTDSIAPNILGSDNLPIEPLVRYQTHMRERQVEDVKQTIAREEQQQSSFWPTTLAVLAALRGDFRPSIQLQEQKRQTQLAKTLFPVTAKATELINRGEWEQAGAVVNAAATSVGDRSPELMRYLTGMSDRIAKKQEQWAQFETYYEMKKDLIPKDHPNRKYLDALGKAVQRRTPFAEAMLNNLETGQRTHVQNVDGQQLEYFPATGESRQTALPRVVQPSAVDTVAGKQIVFDHGLQSTTDIANIMNRQPVVDKQGAIIPPGSERAQQIISDFSGEQRKEAEREMAKLIPVNDIFAAAYLHPYAGGTQDELARRAFSEHPDKVARAQDWLHQREIQKAEAPIMAAINKDRTKWASVGGTFLDENGKEIGPKTFAEYDAAGKKVIATRKDLVDTVVTPTLNTIQGLDYAVQMANELKKLNVDLSTPGGRLSLGVKRLISGVFKISVDDAVPVAETLAAIVNKAIEETNSGLKGMGRPSAEIGAMKVYTAGDFANPEEAVKALTILQGRLKQVLLNSVPVSPQTALPSRAPSATPYVPQSDTSVVSPKGGARIPKGAAVTKGDVEGALKAYDKGQGGTATPATGTSAAPTQQTAPSKKYTTPTGKAYKNIQVE